MKHIICNYFILSSHWGSSYFKCVNKKVEMRDKINVNVNHQQLILFIFWKRNDFS